MAKARHTGQAFAAELLQPAHRFRALQRQQHTTSLAVADAYPLGFELLFDPGGVAAGAGGVDHHHHFGVTAVVNDQVVADATGFIQQHRVLGFAGANALQIAGHQPLEFVFDA